jgi:predicted nucleotidyltransferase
MTRDEIIAELRAREDRLKALGATSLYMFGSRARGDNRPDSDLDLFIDWHENSKRPSLLDLIAFENEFQDRAGVTVQLTLREGLFPLVRASAEREAVRIF